MYVKPVGSYNRVGTDERGRKIMDHDYVALQFSGKDLGEVANKMVMFLNSIKGVNLMNAQEAKDGEEKPVRDDKRKAD